MSNTVFAVWCVCLNQILLQAQDCVKTLQGLSTQSLKTTQKLCGFKSIFGIKQIGLRLWQLDTEEAGSDPAVWALRTIAVWHKMPPPWSKSDPNPLALHKVWSSDESDLHTDAHKPSSAHENFEC